MSYTGKRQEYTFLNLKVKCLCRVMLLFMKFGEAFINFPCHPLINAMIVIDKTKIYYIIMILALIREIPLRQGGGFEECFSC